MSFLLILTGVTSLYIPIRYIYLTFLLLSTTTSLTTPSKLPTPVLDSHRNRHNEQLARRQPALAVDPTASVVDSGTRSSAITHSSRLLSDDKMEGTPAYWLAHGYMYLSAVQFSSQLSALPFRSWATSRWILFLRFKYHRAKFNVAIINPVILSF